MKKTIRAQAVRRRDLLSPEKRSEKDIFIRQKLFRLSEFKTARSIFLYVSFKSEVETYTIIAEALRKGKKVIVPKVNPIDNVLILYDLRSISELEKGYMGIAEPRLGQDRVVALNTVDLVVAPGTAFDRTGKRLGYGGGYYDRLLAGICNIPVIALAYSEQILDKIPAEDHDVNVDIIVTEYEIIRIRDAKNSDA